MRKPVDDQTPITAQMAKALFAPWRTAQALVLAVSGGPDSMALLWLVARWRRGLTRGPDVLAVTVDHDLRPEGAREARDVKRLAAALDMPHRTLRWTGTKPATGVLAAARAVRYGLLAKAAHSIGADHVLTAHTRDDQAETLLMRMARGSGLAGLAAMAPAVTRDGIGLARPLLNIPKARLVATLDKAGVGYATDPTNADPHYTRARIRAMMPALAAEGFDARNLARLAGRLARADAALELMVDGAERFLALQSPAAHHGEIDARVFSGLAEEIRVRLLLRLIDRIGHEGPAELGKVEALLAAMAAANTGGSGVLLRRTLAGAMISMTRDRLRIAPAPPRRRRAD